MNEPVISRNAEVMGGTAVFHGTRVPAQTLIDYLEAGESIDDFLAGFPSVTRAQVVAFLEQAKDRLIEAASLRFSSTNVLTGACLLTSSVTTSRQLIKWGGRGPRMGHCLRLHRSDRRVRNS
jgi:uncharacterized protein (DUF433 family)